MKKHIFCEAAPADSFTAQAEALLTHGHLASLLCVNPDTAWLVNLPDARVPDHIGLGGDVTEISPHQQSLCCMAGQQRLSRARLVAFARLLERVSPAVLAEFAAYLGQLLVNPDIRTADFHLDGRDLAKCKTIMAAFSEDMREIHRHWQDLLTAAERLTVMADIVAIACNGTAVGGWPPTDREMAAMLRGWSDARLAEEAAGLCQGVDVSDQTVA